MFLKHTFVIILRNKYGDIVQCLEYEPPELVMGVEFPLSPFFTYNYKSKPIFQVLYCKSQINKICFYQLFLKVFLLLIY